MKIIGAFLFFNITLFSNLSQQYNFKNLGRVQVLYYYVNKIDNSFVLQLWEIQKQNESYRYFLFKENKFEEITLNEKNYNVIYWKDQDKLDKKYRQIREIEKGVRFAETEKEKYILSSEEPKDGLEYLYYFDGNELLKIDLGDIHPDVLFNESFMFFDKERGNLYFPGYLKAEKTNDQLERGIYVYNIKSRKTVLFIKSNRNIDLRSPYRIPKTNKIIMIQNGQDHDEVIIKEALESLK